MHGKGMLSNIKGTITNAPIELAEVCNVLPTSTDSNGVLW